MANKRLITTIATTEQGSHTEIRVWVRSGLSGELIVPTEDAEKIVRRLCAAETVTREKSGKSQIYRLGDEGEGEGEA